jgi:death on curing protein
LSQNTSAAPPIRYLTLDDVLAMYEHALIRTDEVPQGIRDRGLLESAVMRPRFLAHYAGADLIEQAAALATGISRSQALVDGNKRVGHLAGRVFLRRNGVELATDPLDFARVLLAVTEPAVSTDAADQRLTAWLREHTAPLANR